MSIRLPFECLEVSYISSVFCILLCYNVYMTESGPNREQTREIDKLIKLYFFPEGEDFYPLPDDLKTVAQIKEGIEIAYVSLYGIKLNEDGTYTVALIDENYSEVAYEVPGLSESDVLDICDTNYKEKCPAMDVKKKRKKK